MELLIVGTIVAFIVFANFNYGRPTRSMTPQQRKEFIEQVAREHMTRPNTQSLKG